MIVSCPACATRYLVDTQQLGAIGRMVRCGQCGHSWYEAPPAGEPLRYDLSDPDAPPPLPGERRGLPVISPRPHRGGFGKALAVLFLLLMLAGGGAAGVIVERDHIMNRFPATRPYYARLEQLLSSPLGWLQRQPQLQPLQQQQPDQGPGPAQVQDQNRNPGGGGLEIRQLTPKRAVENGIPVLMISGQIFNSSAGVQTVPRLRATLRDAHNNPVASWTFSPDQASLPPGGSETFETSMAQPSDLASGVVVTFESGAP